MLMQCRTLQEERIGGSIIYRTVLILEFEGISIFANSGKHWGGVNLGA